MMGWMAPLRHRRAKLVFLENHQEREPSMSEITTIGLDLAKHVFEAIRRVRRFCVAGSDPEPYHCGLPLAGGRAT